MRFARNKAQSKYPKLWDGLVFCSSPSLGPTGLTLFDHSGYGNHGVLTNMDAATGWVMSERGWVNDYDGGAYVDLGSMGAEQGSVVIPYKTSRETQNFFGRRISNSTRMYFGTNSRFFFASIGTTGAGVIQDNVVTADGKWHVGIATWVVGGEINLYVDGKLKDNGSTSGTPGTGQVVIGARQRIASIDSYTLGSIGDIFFYNRVLNANEIMDMYLGAHPLTPIRGVVLKAPDLYSGRGIGRGISRGVYR